MEFSALRLHLDRNIKLDSRMSIASGKISSKEDQVLLANKTYLLPKITAVAFTAVLESAVDSLIVLGNIMDLPKVNVDMEYKSISNKFSEPYRIRIYDHETLETREEALEQERRLKFHKDRWVFSKSLKQILFCGYIVEHSWKKYYERLVWSLPQIRASINSRRE